MTSTLNPPTTTVALRLVEPLPGFDDDLEFTLTAIDPDGILLAMRSVTTPGLRFVLTPSECFFDGYRPELGGAVGDALGVTADTELTFLLVLTIGEDLCDATANLRAPLVLARGGDTGADTGVRTAVQVVLDDESLSMREPLVPSAPPL